MNLKNTTALLRNEKLLTEQHPLSSYFGQVNPWKSVAPDVETDVAAIHNCSSLEDALLQFKTGLLIPVEFPAIYQSFLKAQENDFEAIRTLDAELRKQVASPEFARASQAIGRTQLKRLRPLKDNRLTQKYLAAMESEAVNGWHTIVYGISLEIYSIPVRQGLVQYAHRTISSLIEVGANKAGVDHSAAEHLFNCTIENIPQAIDALLPKFSQTEFRVV